MHVFINEQLHELKEASSLVEAIEQLSLQKQGLAIAVNSSVVPQSDWAIRILKEGDRIMLIRATQGG